MQFRLARGGPCAARASERRLDAAAGRGRAGFAPLAPLVAVALDLPRQLFLAEVHGVLEVPRAVASAQRGPLHRQGRLDDLALRVRRVALVLELDLEAGQFGDLLGDLREALLHVLAKVLRDGD